MPDRLFLTGTDTDVGKTITAAAWCAAFGHDYWKPVQSGLTDGTDSDTMRALTQATVWPEGARLTMPTSPHTAARDDGVSLDPHAFTRPSAQRLLVEGAGGWMVPYGRDPDWFTADLVKALDLPVVVVARSGLGTLNHTLLTLRAIRADGCRAVGLVLVGNPHPDNEADLPRLGGVPVLARLPRVDDVARDFEHLVAAMRSAQQG